MKSLAVIDILKFTLVGGLATEKPLQKQANHRKCSDLGGGGGGGWIIPYISYIRNVWPYRVSFSGSCVSYRVYIFTFLCLTGSISQRSKSTHL